MRIIKNILGLPASQGAQPADGRADEAGGGEQGAGTATSPDDFIPSPSGSIDYGEITPEMAKAMRRQAGKIRLQRGEQNANGTGWGLAHIEANHGSQIRNAGFPSVRSGLRCARCEKLQ